MKLTPEEQERVKNRDVREFKFALAFLVFLVISIIAVFLPIWGEDRDSRNDDDLLDHPPGIRFNGPFEY